MTQQIILCYRNILETSTVTVSSEDADFPSYRLYDRGIGRLFKGDSTPANFYITLDQGAIIQYEVDRLFIPAGHNLDGLTIKLQYSSDNFSADSHDALSWTQSGAGLIDKPFIAPETDQQYWRLNIASPAAAPELAEILLTEELEFERNPNYGLGQGERKNIQRDETQSGLARFIKLGEPKKWREYSLTKIGSAQKSDFENWDIHCEGIKSFYIEDHEGSVFFAELQGDLEFHMEHEGRWGLDFSVLEVLG